MKNLFKLSIALLAFSLVLTSCKKDDDDPVEPGDEVISANISENTTWETGKVYQLAGRIAVLDGVTLTIEPGTVIKGEAGTGANATALLIAQGGKLIAEGTAEKPIIFTSVADEIKPGEIASPNLDPTMNGLWGGLIICGKAPISVEGDAEYAQIEGIPASDENGRYGGKVDDDNSGVIKYVSIRHGGANIGEGNEINGLTLGGVGTGTVIENVEIVSNQDDGIEWFGGTVNAENAVVWNTGDDAIDADQGWSGTLTNVVIINPGDYCFELDGAEGSVNKEYFIKKGTAFAQDANGLAQIDDKGDDNPKTTWVDMSEIYFTDISYEQTFSDNPDKLTLTSIEASIDTLTIADYFLEGTDADVTEVADGANTVGADLSKFDGWSWADVAGAME